MEKMQIIDRIIEIEARIDKLQTNAYLPLFPGDDFIEKSIESYLNEQDDLAVELNKLTVSKSLQEAM